MSPLKPSSIDAGEAELIVTLRETLQRLEELAGRPVDGVADRDDRTIQRQAREQLRHYEAAQQAAVLNALRTSEQEQRQLAQQLEIERSRLVAAQRVAKVGSWETDLTSKSVVWSDETHRIHETDPATFRPTHQDFLSLVHPDDRAAVDEAFVRSACQQGPCAIEHRLLLPDGRIKFIEERWQPVFDEKGNPLRATGTCQDITERHQAAAALEELSQRTAQRERVLNTALSSISDFTYIYGRDGRFLFVNQPLLNLWGITLEEAIGKNFSELGYPDELARKLQREVQEVFESGKSVTDETAYTSPSGLDGYYEYIFSPVLAADGSVEFVVGATRDVTHRRQSENALRDSNEKFQQLADNITDAFWIRSPDMQTVHYVSPAFERIWGRSSDSLYADPEQWTNYILPEDRERVQTGFRGLTGEARSLDMEYRIVRPDGEIRWIRVRGFQVRDAAGKLIRITGIVTDIDEHKRTETALRESEAEFRTLAEAMPQIVWITRPDGWSIYFSQQWVDYTGLTLEESRGHGWGKPLHPDDQQRAWDAWKEALATNGGYSLEARLRRADGVYRWWLIRAVPLQDAAGNVVKWFGTCTDIHDLKMAELEVSLTNQALRESERRFRDLLGNIEMVSIMLDKEGRITHCNDYLLRVTGWRREEVMGQDWFALFVPHGRGDVKKAFSALLEEAPTSSHYENEILTRSGAKRLIQWNNTTLRSGAGEVIGTASIGDDITDRREAEGRLRLQSVALNAADNAMLIAGRDLAIVWVNPAFTLLTGYAEADAIGKNMLALLKSDVPDEALYKKISDTILAGESWSGETTNRRKDGQPYAEAQTITPVKNDDGTVSHFISIKTDLTARRQIELQLRQAQKMEAVGQLAAGVAHEFNNLLQTLMSMAAITRLRSVNPQIVKIAAEMEVQIRRGASVTQQLLLFSRHQTTEMSNLDLGEHVQKAGDLLRRLIPENITLVMEISSDRTSVKGDAGQVQQVLLNLAINARDSMPAGGTLTLRVAPRGAEVLLEIEDTGSGFDEATRARIFEPFFTTKEVGKGTGLGLAVVYGIVEQHGGRIEVRSVPGEGSRFRVILPAAASENRTGAETGEDGKIVAGSGRVLLVEDEEGVREGVAILLEMIGYHVTVACRGEDALALALEPHPDLLLTDVTLPGIGGPALAERLRQRWPSLRVVLMSGYLDEASRSRAIDQGWLFLQKPFEIADLARQLRAALDR